MRVEEIQPLVADVVLPPPDITVSQWADEDRRLSSESVAERGEWRTDQAPDQRAIMDALSASHPCEQVVLMSGPGRIYCSKGRMPGQGPSRRQHSQVNCKVAISHPVKAGYKIA